ncbi:MAG: Stealth CR1 domain-containing protein [Clostridia bacterium]|nr:Stealth CR1 domain-containing protein [Clostridia bacterium]
MDKIDFVVTWVDGNDPQWQAEKRLYQKDDVGDLRDERYREWDNFQYWFRAVEAYAPWFNKIHFVTCGHVPAWLNVNHPKLQIVKHSDYIPAEYLPTFSARPIEFFLHRIPGLSDAFVYFNDDMFVTAPVKQTDFFRNGLPLESAILNVSMPPAKDMNGKIIAEQELYMSSITNTLAINRHFSKKTSIAQNRRKWFTLKYGKELSRSLLLMPWGDFLGFADTHLPYSLLKKTFDDVWEKEADTLKKSCSHRFREPADASGRLITFWQIASGQFEPRRVKDGHYFRICDQPAKNAAIYRAITEKTYKIICINDKVSNAYFDQAKEELKQAFQRALPEKSSFEL